MNGSNSSPEQTTNMGATITLQPTLDDRCQQTIRPPHPCPVVLIRRSTSQAYLIITAIVAAARPREPMRTTSPQKIL
jgi:hypothetical protein